MGYLLALFEHFQRFLRCPVELFLLIAFNAIISPINIAYRRFSGKFFSSTRISWTNENAVCGLSKFSI